MAVRNKREKCKTCRKKKLATPGETIKKGGYAPVKLRGTPSGRTAMMRSPRRPA